MWRIMGVGRTVFLVALAFTGYYAYLQFWNISDSDSRLRQSMAKQVCIPATLGIPLPNERVRIIIAAAHGDVDAILTHELRQALARRNVSVVDVVPWDRLVPSRIWSVSETTLEQNVALAKAHDVPYLVFSQVEDWTIAPLEEPVLSVRICLVDVKLNTIVYSNSFAVGQPSIPATAALVHQREIGKTTKPVSAVAWGNTRASDSPQWIPFIAWLAVCLIAPWLSKDLIATALRSQSNMASLALILVYLMVVVSVGWFTWGDFESKWLTAMLLCGVALPWLGYFEFVCRSVAHRLEH